MKNYKENKTINESMRVVRQKRYQRRVLGGVVWTSWFPCKGMEPPIQLKGFRGDNLKNEYRTIEM